MTSEGKYIVLEGGEYVGKSTQAALLAQSLEAVLVREPGGTHIGEEIRSVILNKNLPRAVETDVLLHASQRATLMAQVVTPALLNQRHVVSDRSWISSAAYQGAGGVPLKEIQAINRFAVGPLLQPDLLVVLDAAPEAVAARRSHVTDYYESFEAEFHHKVRDNFLTLAEMMGGIVIDATEDKDTVTAKIRDVVREELNL